MILINSYRFAAAAEPPGTCLWNSADKEANIVLSNGDLTATKAGAGYEIVRGTLSRSVGKRYFEFTCDAVNMVTGFADAAVVPAGFYLGQHTVGTASKKSIGIWDNSAGYYNMEKGTTSGVAGTGGIVAGQVIGCLIDFTARNVKFYTASTDTLRWNFTDDLTGTWGPFFPATSVSSGGQVTLNCAGPFVRTLGSGELGWDE